jgi:8-oxo-dGTP pyrophosphatase MutT (NUDIX family)
MKRKIVCHDINEEKEEVDVDKLQFRPSVYGILIENGKVLLSKQWDGYDIPGGGVELDETLDEALKREFVEETGLKIKVGEIVHCSSAFFNPKYSRKSKGQYWNCQLIYFLVKKIGGEISIENCDEDEKDYMDLPEWIEIDKLKDLKFYNSIDNEEIIKKALNLSL